MGSGLHGLCTVPCCMQINGDGDGDGDGDDDDDDDDDGQLTYFLGKVEAASSLILIPLGFIRLPLLSNIL